MINPLSSCEFLLKLARNNYCQKSTAILTQDATEHCKRENHSHQSTTTNQAEKIIVPIRYKTKPITAYQISYFMQDVLNQLADKIHIKQKIGVKPFWKI